MRGNPKSSFFPFSFLYRQHPSQLISRAAAGSWLWPRVRPPLPARQLGAPPGAPARVCRLVLMAAGRPEPPRRATRRRQGHARPAAGRAARAPGPPCLMRLGPEAAAA